MASPLHIAAVLSAILAAAPGTVTTPGAYDPSVFRLHIAWDTGAVAGTCVSVSLWFAFLCASQVVRLLAEQIACHIAGSSIDNRLIVKMK